MLAIKLDPVPVHVVFTSVNHRIFTMVEKVLAEHGLPARITSGCDHIHGKDSAHYYNMALDFSITWQVAAENKILHDLTTAMPSGYRYVRESNHLHVERFAGPYPWVKGATS